MRKVQWNRYPRCPRCFQKHACWGKSGPLKRPHRERLRAVAPRIGHRTLLAASCLGCGKLFQGSDFRRYSRRVNDRRPYLDLRCPNCKWGAKAKLSSPVVIVPNSLKVGDPIHLEASGTLEATTVTIVITADQQSGETA